MLLSEQDSMPTSFEMLIKNNTRILWLHMSTVETLVT
jgi:hypothetical protein